MRSARSGEKRHGCLLRPRGSKRAFWAKPARRAALKENASSEYLAADLWTSISEESNNLSVDLRPALTLVLDATDTPGLALAQGAKSFRDHYLTRAKLVGFSAIWVVGKGDLTALLSS